MTAKLDVHQYESLVLYLLAAGVANTTQSVSAFSFLHMVAPVTYSIANVCKRIVIIALAMLFFGGPVSAANLLGIALAIAGVGLYNKVDVFLCALPRSHPTRGAGQTRREAEKDAAQLVRRI